MESLRLELIEEASEELREAVTAPLRDYNRKQNGAFFEARELPENQPRPLNVVAYDDGGNVVGGVLGETSFTWARISFVSVADHCRRRGLGTRLLEAAERAAIARGCKYAVLDTMSYQAPKFYRKRGYRISGQFEDWDSYGHTKYFFVKNLA
jgi:ribosomal protein S18 acetylase RimI-like enzyme